jgi:PAS domain S-box-containing protein
MTVRAWPQLGASALIFHRDITAGKMGVPTSQSLDREFRLLADSTPVMIWMTGPDKKCIFVSRKWLEFTGASPEEALGEEWTKFVHQDDCAALLQAFHTAFNDKYEFSHEYRLRHRDGGFRWVQDSGSPRFDTHHQFSGFTGSVWDLSEQKRASDVAHKATRYARLIQEVAAIAKFGHHVAGSLAAIGQFDLRDNGVPCWPCPPDLRRLARLGKAREHRLREGLRTIQEIERSSFPIYMACRQGFVGRRSACWKACDPRYRHGLVYTG